MKATQHKIFATKFAHISKDRCSTVLLLLIGTLDDFMHILKFHFRMQMKNLVQYSLWYALIIVIYS